MLIRLLCIFIFVVHADFAAAQPINNDYNLAKKTNSLLLSNLEVYHLEPGIKVLHSKMVDGIRSNLYMPNSWGHFMGVLKYFPNHPRALMLVAEVCEIWKDSQKCNPQAMEANFDKAFNINPNDPVIHLIKGQYMQKLGKLDDAIASYRKSLEISPNSANAHYNLGLAYVAKKDYVLANEHAQRAYAIGFPLPGLRNQLTAAGAWKPVASEPAGQMQQRVDAAEPKSPQANPGEHATTPGEGAAPRSVEVQPATDGDNK